jgi:hypothetical protein
MLVGRGKLGLVALNLPNFAGLLHLGHSLCRIPFDNPQCDQDPNGCGQCLNARRKCPGYRKPGDLVFKDESQKVVRKVKADEARYYQKSASSTNSTNLSEESQTGFDECLEIIRSDSTTLPAFNLAPTIEDRAMAFFVANYVKPPDGPAIGHMPYLTRMSGGLPDGLLSSVKAVGLAGYAHSVDAPSLLRHARYHYVQALRSTNEALRSPILATRDSTLVSILILGIYETVTGTNQKSLKAWADHIFGASALLKLRGRKQIYSHDGRQLFFQTVSMLLVTSIQQSLPLPDYIVEWTHEAKSLLEAPNLALICQEVMMEFTMLNANICRGTLSDPETILTRCLELDRIMEEGFARPPPDWKYEIILTDAEPELIYNGRYDIYHNYWISQVWNGMRCHRCLMNERIRKTLLKGSSSKPPIFTSPSYTTLLQRSTDTMNALQADILATVPQHLGYASWNHRTPPPSATDSPWKPSRDPTNPLMHMSGSYFVLWPLWYAGIMDIASEATQRYVVRNLLLIGRELGLQQALFLADVIQNKRDIGFN